MKKKLSVAPGFSFPLDAATETFGILAKKGAGKSNAAVVMAEEMWDAEIPWVAIDPKGDWWGLRSSGEGDSPGLPLPVFGGRHGDVPLEPGAGQMMADLILGQMLTCVLDVSEFSKAEVSKFLVAFADRLYRQAEDEPLHLFLEEAHEYLPQRVGRDEARLVGAWQKIVKQGRFKGLGCTLVSQRSASLNKDVLTQVDTLIVLRTVSPQDRAAVKAWVDVHDTSTEMLDTLPTLEDGEAWVWSPEFLGTLERIKFRRRRTFDSGATPKVGEKRRAPATLADVDLDVIKKQMSETIEKAKATDPRELQKRIKELEKELGSQTPQIVEKVVEVEVEVLKPYVPEWVTDRAIELDNDLQHLREDLGDFLGALDQIEDIEKERQPVSATPIRSRPQEPVSRVQPAPPPVTVANRRSNESDFAYDEDVRVTGGALRMLEVLAQTPDGILSRSQVALLAGLKPSSGTFSNYLSNLRTAGLIQGEGKGPYEILPQGRGQLDRQGVVIYPLDKAEVRARWRAKLTGGEVRMFDFLIENYPEWYTRAQLAEAVEMSVTSGTFSNYLSRLRTNELIIEHLKEVSASPDLF